MANFHIKKLETYDATYKGERDAISINTNEKGSLIRLSIDENINMIGGIDFKVGRPARGNHYHLIKSESFYLLEGKVMGYFKDIDDSEVSTVEIEKGTLIQIEPGCVHAFIAIEDGYAIEYSPNTSEEGKSDAYAAEILPCV